MAETKTTKTVNKMEISQSVANAHVIDLRSSLSSSISCSSLSSDSYMAHNERTPLLRHYVSTQDISSPTVSIIYLKDCLNWRIIGLFLMFTMGLVVATYLLWRETTDFLEFAHRLSLTEHDIWSSVPLEGQSLLEAGEVVNVYMTHTASEECTENCPQLLQTLQHDQLEELPYNFLLAGDCEVYEARGWRYVSNYDALPQRSTLVLAFVGDFSVGLPSSCQLEMAEALLREAVRRKRLQPDYQLFALVNVSRGDWDADALQRKLKQWPRYAGQQTVK